MEVNGKVKDVIVVVREHKDGYFQYSLHRDESDGARFSKISNRPGRDGTDAKAPNEEKDHADTVNLYLDDQNIKDDALSLLGNPYRLITAPKFQAKVPEVKLDLIEQLQKIGIANRIKVVVAENIMAMTPSGVTVRANGFYLGNTIGIALSGSQNIRHVMNHETIHALRSPDLWGGKEYGLFTKAEWQAIVPYVRKNKAIMAQVRRFYSDLDTAGQIEEAIAETYAEWADGNIQHPTKIEQILQKMQDFFEAIGNALRGNGFRSANDVFRSISDGEIGQRQDDAEQGGAGGIKLSIVDDTAWLAGEAYDYGKKIPKSLYESALGLFNGDTLTQAMSGKTSLLALVPGRNRGGPSISTS